MNIFGAIVGGIVKLAGTVVPTLMAVNQNRAITTQTQSLALAQKRDSDTQQLAIKRMEFDAKMEMMRQTVRAKERQEDKEFSLTLKAIEAVEFCQKLTEYLQKQSFDLKIDLPSETQWEYACRAGTNTKYWFGDNDSELKNHAWYTDNSNSQTHSVIEKEDAHTNPWGLADMHGNVWEWCADSWTSNVADFPKDGKSYINIFQHNKSLRGGSWYNYSAYCASDSHVSNLVGFDYDYYGFRVVCV